MKKLLIIGIILITICLSLTIYKEFINPIVNIHDITNTGLKTENKRVYLNATFVAGAITNDNDNGYYVIFGDGVQYIIYISNEKAKLLNSYLLDNPDDYKRIEGVTKIIPTWIEENGKKFTNSWLDNNHSHNEEEKDHVHDITTDEFYQYYGYVYLDTNIGIDIIKIIIYITGITGALFILQYINTKYKLL